MTGFIDPRDIAFPTTTFNIFMVLMVLLGGKGTLWGPVIGAVVFHVIKEVTWTYFLGWQFIALGLLIVVIIVYFQQGIVGWLMENYPAACSAPRSAVRRTPERRARGRARAACRRAPNERRHHRARKRQQVVRRRASPIAPCRSRWSAAASPG